MLRFKRLMVVQHPNLPKCGASAITSFLDGGRRSHEEDLLCSPSQRTTYRSLDIFQFGNKAAIDKERARLSDEMNRGYFADISEHKKHGGKIEMASKTLIPAIEAVKLPVLEVNYPDGTCLKLPDALQASGVEGSNNMATPRASLLCLSFRASSQAMIDSWCVPFSAALNASQNIQIYEVSFIESWLLSLNPIKRLLLRMMRKSNSSGERDAIRKQTGYSFGDQYYFRKELKILNLVTGYIYLLDRFGRIRWQGYGFATEEELKSLLSSTSLLLEEK